MSNTNETIQSVTITDQPEKITGWAGLSLVKIETDKARYSFGNMAISYVCSCGSFRISFGQLVQVGESSNIYPLGYVLVRSGEDMDKAIATFLISCELAECIKRDKSDNKTARERLAEKMAPAYKALGIVASTNAGKFLFAMAYDADCALDTNRQRSASYEGKRPSKSSQDAKYFEGMSLGERNSYVTALARMCEDASNGQASAHMCRRVINMEIDAMRNRTPEQLIAASVSTICKDAWSE